LHGGEFEHVGKDCQTTSSHDKLLLPNAGEIAMTTLNISITNDMREWVNQQIACGRYANASDYVRDLIRTNQSASDAIRIALIEGEQSGESPLSIADIISMEFPANAAQ
jgi:antitoxin ParD1/3/4